MIDQKELSQTAIKQMPTLKAAETFHRAVKTARVNNRPISLKKQEALAKKIVTSDNPNDSAERIVKDVIGGEVYPVKYDQKRKDFADFIGEAARTGEKFQYQLDKILAFKDDFDGEVYSQTIEKLYFHVVCQVILEKITKIMASKNHVPKRKALEDRNEDKTKQA